MMNSPTAPDLRDRKIAIRRQTLSQRRNQPDKETASCNIFAVITRLPEYTAARTLLYYVSLSDEVHTLLALADSLHKYQRVAIPYCVEGELHLFLLHDMEELRPGKYGILEPVLELRNEPSRRVLPADIDFAIVPGVAFDRNGGRIGHGKGYYDRLLQNVRSDAALVAPAFECQIVDAIPLEEHDILMHKIVTEISVYSCNRNR